MFLLFSYLHWTLGAVYLSTTVWALIEYRTFPLLLKGRLLLKSTNFCVFCDQLWLFSRHSTPPDTALLVRSILLLSPSHSHQWHCFRSSSPDLKFNQSQVVLPFHLNYTESLWLTLLHIIHPLWHYKSPLFPLSITYQSSYKSCLLCCLPFPDSCPYASYALCHHICSFSFDLLIPCFTPVSYYPHAMIFLPNHCGRLKRSQYLPQSYSFPIRSLFLPSCILLKVCSTSPLGNYIPELWRNTTTCLLLSFGVGCWLFWPFPSFRCTTHVCMQWHNHHQCAYTHTHTLLASTTIAMIPVPAYMHTLTWPPPAYLHALMWKLPPLSLTLTTTMAVMTPAPACMYACSDMTTTNVPTCTHWHDSYHHHYWHWW